MYRAVLKEIEKGTYQAKAPHKYEVLYQDFKNWGQAKSPSKIEIHEDQINPITSRMLSEHFSQSRVSMPKFDPSLPTEYYRKRYAGGPKSNIIKSELIDRAKLERCARAIQKRFK